MLETIEDSIHQADKLADAEGHPDDRTREKIKQHIEAFFRIQDVIDEFIICDEKQLPDPRCAASVADNFKSKMLRLQMAHNIQNIKSQLDKIKNASSKKAHEGTSSSATNPKAISLQNLRMASFDMAETEVVGFEKPRKKLVDWLVTGQTDLTFVSVVAMGGQGKTTLAKKVFDDNQVVESFGCRVWITVSKSKNIEVLRGMLEELCKQQKDDPPQNIQEMTRESLIGAVKKYLLGKRYVVVFDDVWDSGFWDFIKLAMIDEKKGRRILITTRNMKVVNACRSAFVEILELKGLDDKQSSELFDKKAFHDLKGKCPENLVDISFEIAKKCSGLPLAIVVIGGFLSCKDREPFEWYNFSKNINPEFKEDPNIKKNLGLSYHDLPYNLKSCLLYFGLYPENAVLESKTLTQQWMAEGFVKKDGDKRLEEVAEGYFTELICRNLVQVVSISIDGRATSCRVHDLVHAMILEKCEDLCFCKNNFEGQQSSLNGMIRRLTIRTTNLDNLMTSIQSSHVRSLLVLTSKELPESFEREILTNCRFLKVLDFEDNEKDLEVGGLSHLKYFRSPEDKIYGGRRNTLLKSIGMLENLETLNLRKLYSKLKLPKEICKLRKLRHLLGSKMSLILMKEGIGGMTSLQTLSRVYLDEGERDNSVVELIQELGKLKEFRELVLEDVRGKYMRVLSSSVSEMQQLEKLCIHEPTRSPSEPIDLHLNSPPPKLQILKLRGEFEKLPEWISKLQNLVMLDLKPSILRYDTILKLLRDLPNLLSLTLESRLLSQ
ncbi:disease resistance protein RPM1 [Trifolium repens]|nr:disease resistance protein RPM1 [Trifolium repens]